MVNAEADEFLRCSAFGSLWPKPRGVFQGGELIAAGQGDWIRPTTSGLLLETDIVRAGRHVSKVPILLQKSAATDGSFGDIAKDDRL